jgi:predicted aspartyl protease
LCRASSDKTILDTGATTSFVSNDVLNKTQLRKLPPSYSAQAPDGHNLPALGLADIKLQLPSGLVSQVACVVLAIDEPCLYLGDDWLKQHQAVLNFKQKIISLTSGDCLVELSCDPAQPHLGMVDKLPVPVLSAMQFKNLYKDGEIDIAAILKPRGCHHI